MTKEITTVLDRIEAQQDKQLELGPTAISLDFLRLIYRDPTQQLSTRIRVAMACLPYETPKLLATAIVTHISRLYFIRRRIESLSKGRVPHRPSAASLLRTEAVHAHEWKQN
jgi:hypothetical protein